MQKAKFTSAMVDDYADKLLIGLTKEENKMVLDVINQIPDIEKVTPMSHCLDDFVYELREDVVEESVPIEELLQNCDEYTDREVQVPKVVTD